MRWGGREGDRIMGTLPQHLHFLRGVLHLVLEAMPAQASPQLLLLLGLVGGQLLGAQTHKHTCTKHSHCCPLQGQPPTEQRALFRGGWHRQPPLRLVPHRESPRAKEAFQVLKLRIGPPSLAACLGGAPWSDSLPASPCPPRPGENRPP